MSVIIKDKSLLKFNTFGINVLANYFATFSSLEDLYGLQNLPEFSYQKLVLGGGSNILFTKNFEGFVLLNQLRGIDLIYEDVQHYFVKSAGGEKWHDLVCYCIEKGYAGLENLALIPGTVGAAPLQNIGAYGVELEQIFYSLDAFNLETGVVESFDRIACAFGYRNSIFKQANKNKYIIISVTLQLPKIPEFKIQYGAIQDVFVRKGITKLSAKAIAEAVIEIRQSKLPNPETIGNAGSFFKNPEINTSMYIALKKEYATIPGYQTSIDKIKVPAGWLIEQCGWKGKRVGNTGAHKDQALVLVNYGNATGIEILNLAHEIQQSVFKTFGIAIQTEVNIL